MHILQLTEENTLIQKKENKMRDALAPKKTDKMMTCWMTTEEAMTQ